jgi:hypothetical protein
MGTVSRTLQPQLREFLYELSGSDGADPTRATDTGNDAARNGEPDGEIGLVMMKDADWQDQTGAPADPQAGNIPGGKRDVRRSANFNDGQAQGFAPDSGLWEVESARYSVAPEFLGGDAVSVFYVDSFLPSYFEMLATINADKSRAGFDSNAYVIFDYQSPTDFKFAGIDVKINKLQMGHRDATGWHVDVQTPRQLNADTDYNLLLALNGLTATLVVDNTWTLSYAFEPREIDGVPVNLNTGMVGIGANNARARIDNVVVQTLPQGIVFEGSEDFETTLVPWFGPESGSWQLQGGRYEGTSAASEAIALASLDFGAAYLVELEAVLNTGTSAGLVFDYYGPSQYKFVTLSPGTDEVIVGHRTTNSFVADQVLAYALAGGDHELGISLSGTTVSVVVDGEAVGGYAFNGLVSDGEVGLVARDGLSSFDDLVVRTSDFRFDSDLNDDGVINNADYALFEADLIARADSGIGSDLNHDGVIDIDDFNILLPLVNEGTALNASAPSRPNGNAAPLTLEELAPVADAAIARWTKVLEDPSAAELLGQVRFQLADLEGPTLGQTAGTTIAIDIDGAGYGWFVDDTPASDEEFGRRPVDGALQALRGSDAAGAMDLLTVVVHELGHVLGLEHVQGEAPIDTGLDDTLAAGTRVVPGIPAGQPGHRGEGSRVARSAEVAPDVSIGERARVCARAQIGAGSSVGADSVIGRGAQIGERVKIGANVSVDAGARIPDDSVVLAGSQVESAHFSLADGRWDRDDLRERLKSLFASENDDPDEPWWRRQQN